MENIGALIIGILFYGYIILYIGTGIFQVLQGIYYLTTYRGDDDIFRRQIRYYLIGVTAYFIIAFSLADYASFAFGFPYLMILPIFISIWYRTIVRNHRQRSIDETITNDEAFALLDDSSSLSTIYDESADLDTT